MAAPVRMAFFGRIDDSVFWSRSQNNGGHDGRTWTLWALPDTFIAARPNSSKCQSWALNTNSTLQTFTFHVVRFRVSSPEFSCIKRRRNYTWIVRCNRCIIFFFHVGNSDFRMLRHLSWLLIGRLSPIIWSGTFSPVRLFDFHKILVAISILSLLWSV